MNPDTQNVQDWQQSSNQPVEVQQPQPVVVEAAAEVAVSVVEAIAQPEADAFIEIVGGHHKKQIIVNTDKCTVRVIARFGKEMDATDAIVDIEKKLDARAKLIVQFLDNCTADELLDLPMADFIKVQEAVNEAIAGQAPNVKSATN